MIWELWRCPEPVSTQQWGEKEPCNRSVYRLPGEPVPMCPSRHGPMESIGLFEMGAA